MSSERTLLMVLGMHRSGTSVLTRVLNLLGADVGTELLQEQPDINARGFWEHERLIAINEELLALLGRCWYDFRPLPGCWWDDERIMALMAEAVAFLQDAFADDASLAVIKDPRLCLLLPFWKAAAEEAGWRPVIILATRAPWEVSASLCRRDPLDVTSANLLWLRYTRDSEAESRDLPRSRLDYADLLGDWKTALARTGKELDVAWPRLLEDAEQAVAAEIDPGLHHQRTQSSGEQDQTGSMAEQAYGLLRAEQLDETALDKIWEDFEGLLQRCPVLASGLAEANQRLFSVTNELQALGGDHQQALEVITQKDRQLQHLATELEHAVSIVEERDGQLQQLAAELEHAGSVVKERDAQLKHVQDEYQKLRSHVAIKVMVKLFSLDKK